jgi:hypothetical protein
LFRQFYYGFPTHYIGKTRRTKKIFVEQTIEMGSFCNYSARRGGFKTRLILYEHHISITSPTGTTPPAITTLAVAHFQPYLPTDFRILYRVNNEE